METLLAILLVFLSAVIGAAAAHKFRDMRAFAAIVSSYRLTPRGAGSSVAALLIAAEIAAVALLLLTPVFGAAGLALAAMILGAYACAICINLLRGNTYIDCGCGWGESGGGRLTLWHGLRTASLFTAAAFGAVLLAGSNATLFAGDLLWGALGATPFLLIYVGGDALIDNWSKLTAGTM